MLDYHVLRNKPYTTIYRDGEKNVIKDLLSCTFNKNAGLSGKYIVVDENYTARPDLISFATYGSDEYGDLICKVNGISNPFELNQGMIIFIPNFEELLASVTTGIDGSKCELVNPKSTTNSNGIDDNIFKEFTTSQLANQRLSEPKKPTKENENISTIGKENKMNKKLKSERRSPGEQTVSDSNFYINKELGIVVY